MPIIDHPKYKVQSTSGYGHETPKVVKCDTCGVMANKTAVDAGDAAEAGRKCGFTTRPGPELDGPRDWICLKCASKAKPNLPFRVVARKS